MKDNLLGFIVVMAFVVVAWLCSCQTFNNTEQFKKADACFLYFESGWYVFCVENHYFGVIFTPLGVLYGSKAGRCDCSEVIEEEEEPEEPATMAIK